MTAVPVAVSILISSMLPRRMKLAITCRVLISISSAVNPDLEDALALGWTGVCLRSTGVPYDVRRTHPYMVYDCMEFDVPVGTRGDNYDRFMCRQEEIRQSARILEQALDQMPDEGPVDIDDPAPAITVMLPDED